MPHHGKTVPSLILQIIHFIYIISHRQQSFYTNVRKIRLILWEPMTSLLLTFFLDSDILWSRDDTASPGVFSIHMAMMIRPYAHMKMMSGMKYWSNKMETPYTYSRVLSCHRISSQNSGAVDTLRYVWVRAVMAVGILITKENNQITEITTNACILVIFARNG